MNKLNHTIPAAIALAFASIGHAQEGVGAGSSHAFSANIGVFSQYVFRGLTQTNEDPALQGGFDYSHASGFYAGTKYSYAVSDLFGVADSEGSSYLDLTVAIPLRQSFSLALHAGQQTFEGGGNDALFGYSVTYTHSTAENAGYTVLGKNIGDDQFVIAISRTFVR